MYEIRKCSAQGSVSSVTQDVWLYLNEILPPIAVPAGFFLFFFCLSAAQTFPAYMLFSCQDQMSIFDKSLSRDPRMISLCPLFQSLCCVTQFCCPVPLSLLFLAYTIGAALSSVGHCRPAFNSSHDALTQSHDSLCRAI